MAQMGAQMGIAYGKEVLSGTVARYTPGAQSAWSSLRAYFDVNNAYVMRKLRILTLPFLHKKWARQTVAEVLGHGAAGADAAVLGSALASPAWDSNAPDLYIPCMAFVTYVLCMGLVKGVIRDFHPDVLVAVATSTLATQGVEVLLLRAAMHALAPDAPLSMVRGAARRPAPPARSSTPFV